MKKYVIELTDNNEYCYMRASSPYACFIEKTEKEVRKVAVNALRFYRKRKNK